MNTENGQIEIYADGSRGIYIPQFFARSVRRDHLSGVTEEQLKDISNPDNEWYWDTWEEVLDNAILTDDNGTEWRLHQDGDLFMYTGEVDFGDDY